MATFNVGMMSTFVANWDQRKDNLGAIIEGIANLFITDADAVAHGKRIAKRLLAAPYDIVVLQEMFHADARDAVVDRVTDPGLPDGVRYANVITGFGPVERMPSGHPHPAIWHQPSLGPFAGLPADAVGALHSLLDDSGLMILSRLPFRFFTLPDGSTPWAFSRYTWAAGIDAVAPKGVAAVVVRPFDEWGDVVVAFTHMQADDGSDTHAGIRRAQMDQVRWLTQGVAQAVGTEHAIVMGDLNIRGETSTQFDPPPVPGPEYAEVFGSSGSLAATARDGWREGSCAPTPFPLLTSIPPRSLFDPAITHRGDQQRLDYVIPMNLNGWYPDRVGRQLAVQHLSVANELHDGQIAPSTPIGLPPDDLAAPRGYAALSDHYGVSAIVGTDGDACSPALAVDCTPPDPIGLAPSERSVQFDSVRHGELRWLIVQPGAYRIAVPDTDLQTPLVDLQVFAPTDFSRQVADVMPTDPSPLDERHGRRFAAVDHPLLVRMHRLHPSKNWLSASVKKLFGATPSDAVPLRPWMPSPLMASPRKQLNGPPVARWFEVLLDAPQFGLTQTVSFTARTAAGPMGGVWFDIFPRTTHETPEQDLTQPFATLGTGQDGVTAGHTVTVDDEADRRFLVRMRPMRDSSGTPLDMTLGVTVHSDLTYIVGTAFIAQDETGIDWDGSDEIRWMLSSDLAGVPPRSGVKTGVNTNPHRHHAMSGEIIPFTGQVTATLTEFGDADGDHSATFPLTAAGTEGTPQVIYRTITDAVKNGTYGLAYTWYRVLPTTT